MPEEVLETVNETAPAEEPVAENTHTVSDATGDSDQAPASE